MLMILEPPAPAPTSTKNNKTDLAVQQVGCVVSANIEKLTEKLG